MITTDSALSRSQYSFIDYTRESVVVPRPAISTVTLLDPRNMSKGSLSTVTVVDQRHLHSGSPLPEDKFQPTQAGTLSDRYVVLKVFVK